MKPGAEPGRELPLDAGSESRSLQLALKDVKNYAIYLVDNDGYVSSWSAGAERFYGYTADEIVGQPIARFYTDEDQENGEGAQILTAALHEGTVDVEGWRVRRDGTQFWASVAVEAVRDDDGEVICFAIVMRDNTSKHAAERALQNKDRYFQTSVAGVRDYAIFMLDPAGVITSWNAGAKAIKGYEANEVVGRNFDILYTEEDRASGQPAQALTTALRDGKIETEGWRLRKDGSKFWANVLIEPVRDENGIPIGYVKITRDITERHDAEAKAGLARDAVAHAEKMEAIEMSRLSAMGAMASTLAHELNQPLAAITNYMQGSLSILANETVPPDVMMALSEANKSALRAAAVIRRARELVASSTPVRRPEPVRSVIEEAIDLAIDASVRVGIDCRIDLDPTIEAIYVDRIQILEVLLTLIRNAVEAMSGCDLRRLVVETRRQPDDICEVTIRDTGTGCDDDIADGTFELYTGTPGNKGMGLSICRTIIEAQGGHIWSRTDGLGENLFGFTVPISA